MCAIYLVSPFLFKAQGRSHFRPKGDSAVCDEWLSKVP